MLQRAAEYRYSFTTVPLSFHRVSERLRGVWENYRKLHAILYNYPTHMYCFEMDREFGLGKRAWTKGGGVALRERCIYKLTSLERIQRACSIDDLVSCTTAHRRTKRQYGGPSRNSCNTAARLCPRGGRQFVGSQHPGSECSRMKAAAWSNSGASALPFAQSLFDLMSKKKEEKSN